MGYYRGKPEWGLMALLMGGSLIATIVTIGVFDNCWEKLRIPNTDYCVVDTTEDMYVVVTKNGRKELHIADIDKLARKTGISRVEETDLTRKLYYCGEVVISNEKVEIFAEKPSEDYYDHECEDCFEN